MMTINSLVKPEEASMKKAFIDWYNATVADYDCPELKPEEVYTVWFCYILENAKMLISTTRPDHMYYEVTYHTDKKHLYIDAYKKFKHEDIIIGSKITLDNIGIGSKIAIDSADNSSVSIGFGTI